MPPPERPYLKLSANDKERAEIESIDASICALPERLGGDDAPLIEVLDAMGKYYEANPQLAKLEIENVPISNPAPQFGAFFSRTHSLMCQVEAGSA